MDKAALISMFITFVMSNDVLKYEPVNQRTVESSGVPKFCHKLACPAFKVINSTEEYETREYAATEWVSTQQYDMDYEKSSYTMFMRLFGYIKGANTKKKPIKMTCPVVNRIIPGAGPACESNFTMSFFVAPVQKPAPAPTDPSVFLNKAPRFTAYVRQFGGYAMKYDVWRDQAVALAKALKVDGVEFRTDMYWTAGYDSPFELFGRHNEVWFLGKNENLSL